MFNNVSNICIAVNNLADAVKIFTDVYGLECLRASTIPALQRKSAVFRIGDCGIELQEPLDRNSGRLAQHLRERGEGLFMVEFKVDNAELEMNALQAKGVQFLDPNVDGYEAWRRKGHKYLIPRQPKTCGAQLSIVEKGSSFVPGLP